MKKNGYTLIELLVALTVFTIVVAAPTGFFVSALKGQQKALASQELYDNVSYTLEYMSRSLRMAKKDYSGSCITANMNYETTTDGHNVKFKTIDENYNEICQEFFLDTNDNRLKEIKNGITLPLTARNLEVVSFIVGDHGWGQDDYDQPKVTLFLEIRGKRGSLPELQPEIKIQTSVSQRNLDIRY
ncbi:prepilin-type N-terminal cleavage/methylation domain-containing protein [Candidatus Gottesmanbacteria bacterium]|nr:prepilin-type N-terminal cleavage/methylation domain-containing protein [Candidatus Gottesmanbacteria bacterium]